MWNGMKQKKVTFGESEYIDSVEPFYNHAMFVQNDLILLLLSDI